ncbi:MAG TPA: hypothetical protein VLG67_04470 [Candidatus Saccharimonadales bacterium]|nr:hypothetical protein [Candidatus Saccharimonadales bacterium]
MAKESSNGLVETLEDLFKKAPAIPANGREAIVNITPWIALIFGIIGALALLTLLGVASVFAPFAMYGGYAGVGGYGSALIGGWISFAASILLLAAFPGTKARKLSGWNLLFWSELLRIVGSIVAGSIVGGIIGGLIGLYLIFQIKSYYK